MSTFSTFYTWSSNCESLTLTTNHGDCMQVIPAQFSFAVMLVEVREATRQTRCEFSACRYRFCTHTVLIFLRKLLSEAKIGVFVAQNLQKMKNVEITIGCEIFL